MTSRNMSTAKEIANSKSYENFIPRAIQQGPASSHVYLYFYFKQARTFLFFFTAALYVL